MYCYKFPDKATFDTLAEAAGFFSEDVLVAYTHDRAIDTIGPVETLPGTYDEDGNEITPPTFDNGYHVNFLGEPPEAWDQYLVVVNSASRIWLGGDTQAPSDDILDQL
jgi:hypothetical protein